MGIAFRKGDPLVAKFNKALAELKTTARMIKSLAATLVPVQLLPRKKPLQQVVWKRYWSSKVITSTLMLMLPLLQKSKQKQLLTKWLLADTGKRHFTKFIKEVKDDHEQKSGPEHSNHPVITRSSFINALASDGCCIHISRL